MLDFAYNAFMQFFSTLADTQDYIVFLTAFTAFVMLFKWLIDLCGSRHV